MRAQQRLRRRTGRRLCRIPPERKLVGDGPSFLDSPVEGDDLLKAQVHVVRFGRGGMGIQLGVCARIDGGEPEPALVLGLWAPERD